MTVREALDHGTRVLRKVGIESHRIDSSLLLEKAAGKPRSWLFAHLEDDLDDPVARQFIDLVSERAKRRPLVHLTNKREFYGLELFIDERVLTPRIETEKMVEWAIKHVPEGARLVDIGTGSGALAIAIKKHRPDLEVWATDVSPKALEVAEKNAKTHQLDMNFLVSDLWEKVDGLFGAVVTNLPYVKDDADLMPEVKKEPQVALFGGEDGLDIYRRFLKGLPERLENGGHLFTESDPWQHADLIKEASRLGLDPIEQDYFILGFQDRRIKR